MLSVIIALCPFLFIAFIIIHGPFTIIIKMPSPSNANNNPFLIRMGDHLGENFAPIWAQEYYEATTKLRNPKMLFLRLIQNKPAMRELEIMGHEIEVQVASKLAIENPESRRKSEARSLTNYKQFAGFTEAEISTLMVRATPMAKAWVTKNWVKIQKRRKN